ncbi:protein CFAP20DC-like [Watersipora subatra]|uniref:protein CFAP20DC-like n=1 Tax=Watersipora subatra TaxID=2589382 RepID=UPI00355B7282
MFKHDYQGGNFFEIFSAQGKDPTGQWKTQGGIGIRKIYEKEVKSYVYNLEGTVATTKMQLPKDAKQSLSLVQRYLIFQLIVPKGGEFSLEVGVTDIGGNKRRLNMSTSVKEITATPLHAKLPLTALRKSIWVNCCCDLVNIVGETWPGQTFGKVDSISVSANCKLRRIITMKHQPPDTTDDDSIYGCAHSAPAALDSIPRQHQLAADVTHYTQLIDMHKIRAAEMKVRGERPSPIDLDLSASGKRGNLNDSFHIAFGTKIEKPPTASVGRKSTSSGLPSHRENMGRVSNGSVNRESYDPSTQHMTRLQRHTHDRMFSYSNYGGRQRLLSDPGKTQEVASNSLNESKSWSGTDIQEQKQQEAKFSKPHPPPRDGLGEPGNKRKLKVRSSERQHRTPADAHLKPHSSTNGHKHTVSAPTAASAPSISHHKHSTSPRENALSHSTLSPLKFNKLSSDRKAQVPSQSAYEPKQHANKFALQPLNAKDKYTGMNAINEGSTVPVVWTSQTADVRVPEKSTQDRKKPWYEEASRNVKEEHDKEDGGEDEEEEEENRLALIDSLEKFAKETQCSSSDEESTSNPVLFHFKSPPQAANRLSKRIVPTALASKNLFSNREDSNSQTSVIDSKSVHNTGRPNHLPIYSPSSYNTPAINTTTTAQPTSGAEILKKIDTLQPRPPDSPRTSSRPGSGRLRSRNTSRASNNSNKPTPESSGTGEELSNAIANHKPVISHTETNGNIREGSATSSSSEESPLVQLPPRLLRHEEDFQALPSPLASEKEPRISSAGKRGGSASSDKNGVASLKDDLLIAPQVQQLRMSDRGSPLNSSRGSTRLSRKSLREIPVSDKQLANAQYSPNSPRGDYEPKSYQQLNETFDEKQMLEVLKKEQEVGGSIDEQNNLRRPVATHHYQHEVSLSDGEHSSDESYATTSVPVIGSHDYKEEMRDTLERSDTRDLTVFSPPISLTQKQSVELSTTELSLSHRLNKGSEKRNKRVLNEQNGVHCTNDSSMKLADEEELDLVYDPELNCYYDPVTHKYYELV